MVSAWRRLANAWAGRRAADYLLIIFLASIWSVVFIRAIGDGLRTEQGFPGMNVSSAPAIDDYPVVLSPIRQCGFEVGDRLESVDGEDLRGSSAIRFYDRVTRAARERGHARIRVSRGGERFEKLFELSPSRWWWMRMGVAAAEFLVGLLLLVRAPQWHLARRTFVALVLLSALDASFNWGFSGFRSTALEMNLAWPLLTITVGLAIWNVQEFTRSARPVPSSHRSLAVLGAGAIALNLPVCYYLPSTLAVQTLVIQGSTVIVGVLLVLGFARAYIRSDPLERRKVRWVFLGFCVARAGGIFGVSAGALGISSFGDVVQWLTALAFPAGILVSVTSYHWLDIDRLISAAASYTILTLGVAGTAFAALPGFSPTTAIALGIDESTAQWLLAMGLVVVAIPAHVLLWPRIDRRMFAQRHERMLGFERLLEEIASATSVQELIRISGERVDELLEPTSIVVYARADAHFASVFSRGRAPPISYEHTSLLVRALEQRAQPILAGSSEIDGFDRAALETLGVELIVPIRGRQGLAGFACLGRKRSGDIYLPQEIAHLGTLASRCFEVLLRLTPESENRAARQIFRRDGELWTIASGGREIRLRDMRGLHYLVVLLREPGREFPAIDLVSVARGLPAGRSREDPALHVVRGLGDAGQGIDARARAAYRARLREVEADCAEAERHGDLARLARASDEREALLAELVAAANGQRAASHDERARLSVTKAIGSALAKITERHPDLGAHLSATIRRGYRCAYVPDPRIPVEWET